MFFFFFHAKVYKKKKKKKTVNSPTFASTSKWIILRITLFASPDFSFPFCIGLRERSIKIFSSALLFLVFVATIVVVAWNHTTIITCTLNFFFYPFAFILYNFFTRYIYISKFLFFFPPTKFIKRKQSGWALTGINWPRSKSNYPFLGWISPDRNFWINPRWGYHISILA